MYSGLPRKPINRGRTIITDLQVAVSVEEEVLWLEIAMRDALRVEILDTHEKLLEATLALTRTHLTLFNRSVEVSTGAVLHDFAPVMCFVLYEIHRLDNINVVERRGDAKLGSQFLDILFLCLVLPTLAEFLDSIEFLFTPIPLVSETDDTSRTLTNRNLLANPVLLQQTRTRRTPGTIPAMV